MKSTLKTSWTSTVDIPPKNSLISDPILYENGAPVEHRNYSWKTRGILEGFGGILTDTGLYSQAHMG